jgi:hypothetical protein
MVPEGQGGGDKMGSIFYICILLKWPISIKLGTNISRMMGNSNEGPNPLQRGIITKMQK